MSDGSYQIDLRSVYQYRDGTHTISAIACNDFGTCGSASASMTRYTPSALSRSETIGARYVSGDEIFYASYQLAIDAAAAAHQVELSPDERAEVEQRVLAEHAANVDAARKFRAAIEGAARVRAGESLETVAADLARADVPKALIEQSVNEYRTEAEARRALACDFVAESDAAVRTYLTREKLSAKLRELISTRAREAGVSEDAAADAFWKEIVARYHIRIVDPRYQSPDWKGALKIHETTFTTTP